jgi:hypothetical protein
MLFLSLRQLIAKSVMKIIGRKREQDELMTRYHSSNSEFVAIYGRRRIGKTYLVNCTFKEQYAFKHTGLSPFDDGRKVTMTDQLQAFHYSLLRFGQSEETPVPKTWLEAFFRLENLLSSKADGTKQVVFIDELPWMDTPRSKFVTAFEGFYNNWASERSDILLIICGSSSAWIAFIKTGNPNCKELPAWEPFNPDENPTMVLDNTPELKKNHDAVLLKYW